MLENGGQESHRCPKKWVAESPPEDALGAGRAGEGAAAVAVVVAALAHDVVHACAGKPSAISNIIIIMVLFYLFIQYYAVLKEISIR